MNFGIRVYINILPVITIIFWNKMTCQIYADVDKDGKIEKYFVDIFIDKVKIRNKINQELIKKH